MRLIINLLHIDMVHMPLVERIGLADSRIPIAVLVLRELVGVVSHLPALVTLNLAKVLLCIHHLTAGCSSLHCHCHACAHCGGCGHYGCGHYPHYDCVHCHHDDYVLHSHYRKYAAASVVLSYTCYCCCCSSSCSSQWPAAFLPTQ